MYLKSTTNVEVFDQINQLNSSKRCGYDGISAKFIKIAADIISPILANMSNLCFKPGVFRSSLKIAKVELEYKNGDKINPAKYRPISIILCISKTIENS